MTLRRRVVVSGLAASVFYGAIALLVVSAADGIKPLHQAVPAFLIGLIVAFALGSFTFGVTPHFIGRLMENSSSTFDLINKGSLAIALVSILVGVTASLLLVFGLLQAIKPLQVAITLFIGSIATMCSLKFFYANRDSD